MESENNLFDIGKEIDLPIWDIIRYNVFRNLLYPEVNRKKLSLRPQRNLNSWILIFLEFIKTICILPLKKATIIVFTCSRYIDKNGCLFDKSAIPILNNLKQKSLIIEANLNRKNAYLTFYDMSNIMRRFIRIQPLDLKYFDQIIKILYLTFDCAPITHEEFNEIIKTYKVQYIYYKHLIRFKNPKKIIICTGNPKALIKVTKGNDIETYLVQHAGIELDEIDYSYPSLITPKSNILFPDYILTFGSYWCKTLNAPAKEIIPIGNDFFYNKPIEENDNSILFVSTIIHGSELSKLAIEVSKEYPQYTIIYKLHPNEFHNKKEYLTMFMDYPNIKVISNETETDVLIAKSQIVVLIVSAVLYEALQQGKRVGIYKRINYERQLLLGSQKNIYFFDNVKEFIEILKKDVETNEITFFEKTNQKLINNIFNQ